MVSYFFKNQILNESEISQKKIILKSKPTDLRVTLTNRCNLNCIMCSDWRLSSWDIPKKTVKEIITLFPYLQYILWQGGEVFLSDYFEELFEKAASYPNIRQDITTNGLFIDERWAERLVKANVNLIFSIDGVTKETYEYIRREAKFEDLLKSIDMVNKYREKNINDKLTYKKINFIVHVVIMKSNYHQLSQFVDFANEYKFDTLQFAPIHSVTWSENIFLHKDPEAADYLERITPEILKKTKEYKINLLNWLPSIKKESNSNYLTEPERLAEPTKQMQCYWPWRCLFIGTAGWVTPHCLCKEDIGNVYKNSLDKLWNNELMQSYRKRILNNDYKNICVSGCFLRKSKM